jgi:hypothetical protein
MPHRRRLHALAPPLPPPHTAFDLADPDSRLPLLADYARLKPVDVPAAPPSAHWSPGSSAFTTGGTEPATASTSTATGSSLAPPSIAAAAGAGGRDDAWVRRSRESYYLQLSFAIRITSEAFLAGVPPELLLRRISPVDDNAPPELHADLPADAAAVSYRLWVRIIIN